MKDRQVIGPLELVMKERNFGVKKSIKNSIMYPLKSIIYLSDMDIM